MIAAGYFAFKKILPQKANQCVEADTGIGNRCPPRFILVKEVRRFEMIVKVTFNEAKSKLDFKERRA